MRSGRDGRPPGRPGGCRRIASVRRPYDGHDGHSTERRDRAVPPPGGRKRRFEVLLGHPGGPFFTNRDAGHWTIPKGEADGDEELVAVARREFEEETGNRPPDGDPIELGSIVQKGGKVVHAWALEGDLDPATADSQHVRDGLAAAAPGGGRPFPRSTGSSGSTSTRRSAASSRPRSRSSIASSSISDSRQLLSGVSGYSRSAHADLRRAERQRPRPARAVARRRPALPRAPPPPRPAAVAAGRSRRASWPSSTGSGRSSSTRSTSPAGTTTSSCSPGSRATAASGRTRCCTRSGALYETYNKGLSLVPTAELPWYRVTWDRAAPRHEGGTFDEHAPLVEELLERIRDDGPLSSTDVEPRAAIDWYWRPTNQVRAILEALAEAGILGLARRDGNRRVYDLVERLFPAELLAQRRPDPRRSSATSCCRATGRTACSGRPGSAELWLGHDAAGRARARGRAAAEVAGRRVLHAELVERGRPRAGRGRGGVAASRAIVAGRRSSRCCEQAEAEVAAGRAAR